MSRSSSAKYAPWLASQISTARRNLAEWPAWMKEAARFERVNKDAIASVKGTQPLRRRAK